MAVAKANHDWVLLLDADEACDATLQRSIRQTFAGHPNHTTAFALPRSLVFLGRLMQYSGQNRRPIVRLFNREYARVNDAADHEKIETTGPIVALRGELRHDSYASLRDYLDKLNVYTSRSAEILAHAGRRPAVWVLPFRFLFTFLLIYIVRGGFLDGFPGFIWAFLSAVSPIVKYTKLYEMNRLKP